MNRTSANPRRISISAAVVLGGAIGLGLLAQSGAAHRNISPETSIVSIGQAPAVHSLAVMSYNVEGLPAPARFGRAASLEQIGDHLAELRAQGRQPNVVILQEAFARAAKRIADEGGYRYVAHGPSADDVNDAPAPAAAASLVADVSHLKGEADGKWIGSGLRILSDYPIVKVDRLAFPAWDCAGYDCLANKGAVIAWIQVPGSPRPVAFIDTHLNSRAASGVAKPRADLAYAYQVAALRQFIRRNVPVGLVAFLGGDFNSGKAQVRQADLIPGLLPRSHNSLRDAVAEPNLAVRDDRDTRAILRRAKDWLYYRGNSRWAVRLTGFEVPFGYETDGSTLSDHLGYEVHYRVGRAQA
jgi:hypothetical protein